MQFPLAYSGDNRSRHVQEGFKYYVNRLNMRHIRLTEEERQELEHLTLSTAPGRGSKIKLDPVKDLLPQLIENHSRNLNPVPNELEKKHGAEVCKSTLQTFLKGIRLQAETGSVIS
ncbi:hypothetical protein Barb6XT_01256 [Bacteroidales bacterium Barb6XT]|nr:hypothetical protein Barb6XT_01334 [Bacteroidales bacterium Barb6XT]OAV67929.1 hypothetical protein Barb6XT_01256 [Bacteroidales bacterium Barb6XT]